MKYWSDIRTKNQIFVCSVNTAKVKSNITRNTVHASYLCHLGNYSKLNIKKLHLSKFAVLPSFYLHMLETTMVLLIGSPVNLETTAPPYQLPANQNASLRFRHCWKLHRPEVVWSQNLEKSSKCDDMQLVTLLSKLVTNCIRKAISTLATAEKEVEVRSYFFHCFLSQKDFTQI